jgi:RNA polymerase sigma-70 factor (ECF subfamily)
MHESGTPLDFVIAEESYERMISNISKMPEKYSEVLVLRYFCEYSNGEIAEILNISNGNVRSRLHRARKMLVEIMEEVDFDEQSGIKG